MNPEVKQLWVDALRSGEYKQTNSYLHVVSSDDDQVVPVGFCCLGVLCDLAVKHGVELSVTEEVASHMSWKEYGGNSGDLPLEVIEWAGLDADDSDPDIDEGIRAAGANDDGETFEAIANMIERNL